MGVSDVDFILVVAVGQTNQIILVDDLQLVQLLRRCDVEAFRVEVDCSLFELVLRVRAGVSQCQNITCNLEMPDTLRT